MNSFQRFATVAVAATAAVAAAAAFRPASLSGIAAVAEPSQPAMLHAALFVAALFLLILYASLRDAQLRLRRLQADTVELIGARDAAVAAAQRKSRALIDMTHELRTPFQGVFGMLSLVDDGRLTSEQQRHLGLAKAAADHLLGLLDEVLDSASLEQGRIALHAEPIKLRDLLDDVTGLMRYAAHRRGITLQVHALDTELPCLHADARRVRQVLFNMLNNAIKFTAEGTVTLRVAATEPMPGRCRLRFDVEDTGIGMDAATIERLFQPFQQADASISRRFGGTGLGLSISRELAALMGGTLTATSEPGRGSCFTFVVEVAEAEPAEDRTTMGTSALRVLAVDDEAINREVLTALLRRDGHSVITCESGEAAIELARDCSFDLVVADVQLGGIDGIETARRLRSCAGTSAAAIVVISADGAEKVRRAASEAGALAFCTKPIQPASLRRCVAAATSANSKDAATSGRRFAAGPTPQRERHWLDVGALTRLQSALPDGNLPSLLGALIDDRSGTVAKLRACLKAADVTTSRRCAHALCGSSGSLGLSGLAELARAIERAPDPASLGTGDELVARLDAAIVFTRAACIEGGWMNASPSPTASACKPHELAVVQ